MSLWKTYKIYHNINSPHRRKKIKNPNLQRASFCICNKASYTVEAAIVIPLLAAYLVLILFFFPVLQIQRSIEEALLYAGRKTAVESSIVESEVALLLSAEAYLHYAIKENPQIQRYIKYGERGISLLESEFEGEYLYLQADYIVKLPLSFLGISQFHLSNQCYFRKWIGDSYKDEENYFYITSNSEVYHTSLSCRVLDLTIKECAAEEIGRLRGKDGQKYYECRQCEWKENNKERVYYTNYGKLYHNSLSCSALKRTVEKIKKEEVGERRLCSFCNGA